VAYFVKRAGTDFARLRIKHVEAGAEIGGDFPETVLPSASWTPDGNAFFYNQNQGGFIGEERRAVRPDGLWRHEIGQPVETDVLIHPMTWPEAHAIIPTVSADGRFLFVNQIKLVAELSRLEVMPLDAAGRPTGEAATLVDGETASFCYVGEDTGRYFFETSLGAERGRVIGFDLGGPGRGHVEVVPEQALPLASSSRTPRSEHSVLTNGSFYLTYLDGPRHRVLRFGLGGEPRGELALPPATSVAFAGGDRYGDLSVAADGALLIDLWTFTQGPSAWRFDPATGKMGLVAPDRAAPSLENVEAELVFYPAADGASIPATTIARRDTPRDGSAPVLLYGYGASGMPITPEFGLDITAWVAGGGIYVIANIRGGGEYGEAWHIPATRAGKALTFDDFCACADYLIGRGLAVPERLAIRGISAGGLTVGAAMTRRPELFGAVIAEIPLLDPLSAGRDYWSAQLAPWLGNPTDDPEAFGYISAYSPLQNLSCDRRYPPTLVVIAGGDAQLLTDGARKFVATLQTLDAAGEGPFLLHVLRGAGHGGWSKHQQLDVISRELAFLMRAMDAALQLPEVA
jgi:prolyl oligopeptidase